MQQRVKRSWPNAIAVVPEFFHHRKAKDGLVGGVDENVNPNQSGKEFPLMHSHKVNIPL
jgi:hypothetical protein